MCIRDRERVVRAGLFEELFGGDVHGGDAREREVRTGQLSMLRRARRPPRSSTSFSTFGSSAMQNRAMFAPSQHDVRDFFCAANRKLRAKEPLTPLEAIAADWIAAHPEY